MKIKLMVKNSQTPWDFEYINEMWLCQQRKHLYRIIIRDSEEIKPIWVGRLVVINKKGGQSWVSVEKEIGAEEVHLPNGIFYFY